MVEWLKKIPSNGLLVLLLVGSFYIIFLRECRRVADPCPGEGKLIVSRAAWDSLLAVADRDPVVRVDTVWLKGDVIEVIKEVPVGGVDIADTSVTVYADSLVNDSIDVGIRMGVRGELLWWKWRYRPVTQVIHIDSTIYVGVPVEVPVETVVNRRGLYGYGIAGGAEDAFLWGGGVDFITRNDTEIGYMYQRFGDRGFHSVKVGVKLFGSGR
jgi:hypothetical protein